MMASLRVLLGCALVVLAFACASAAGVQHFRPRTNVVEHTFRVGNVTVTPLCQPQVITAVNGMLPGPTVRVREGDTLVVHVINESPYDITIHWHGVLQLRSAWADGPDYVTQCPIKPGKSYTYRFSITEQEGTLWWHAHISYLRATVYGALVILPRAGRTYPFPTPYQEVPILLGEWWDANVVDIVDDSSRVGRIPDLSDAFTINGQPGDLYNCSSKNTFKLNVRRGKTYLLRMVNAALQSIHFFKIANHKMTVVAVDASYTNPYTTDTITIAPGQSMDVLFTANQRPGRYYMAARVYQGSQFVTPQNTTTTAIVSYYGAGSSTPIMPSLPAINDNATANKFFGDLTALTTAPFWHPVPQKVDERMFITIGVGLLPCDLPGNETCQGVNGQKNAASMNNVSFVPPKKMSILEAFYNKVSGIYTTDFPDQPPVIFDYTNEANSLNSLINTNQGTKVRQFKYNATIEIVMQNTALGTLENHPMHLHGYDFHILAQGIGNYDPAKANINIINPQIRNTVAVPIGGWAVVRFRANNPGVWFIHCHLEVHVPWGLASVFIVENGPTPATSLLPPPSDLPKC